MKQIMQKFAVGGLPVLLGKTFLNPLCLLLGIASLTVVTANAQPTTPPANDNFANALSISGLTGSVDANNSGATTEVGETLSIITDDNSFGVPVGGSIWYSWTASATGNVTFNTFPTNGAGFDTVLAVYTGNGLANLNLVAANDEATGITNGTSLVTFYAISGTTYFVEVAGYAGPPLVQGDTSLNWTQTVPGFSAGTFRLTSTSYTVGNFESFSVYGPKPPMSGSAGARISVTRVGGAAGRVEVHYSVTNNPLVPLQVSSNVDIENTLVQNFDSNGVLTTYQEVFSTSYSTNTTIQYFNGTTFTNIPCGLQGYTVILNVANGATNQNILPYPGGYPPNNTNLVTSVTNSDGSVTVTTLQSTNITYPAVFYAPSAIAFNPKNASGPWDFVPTTGILTFNDFEMTKDIFVTLSTNDYLSTTPIYFLVNLDSVNLATNELQSIPAPSIDSARNSAKVNVEQIWQDPYPNSGLCPGLQSYQVTNLINFVRSTVSVDRNGTNASIAVVLNTVNASQGATMYYSIDFGTANANYNTFSAQSGSDYAIPDNALKSVPEGVVDFNNTGIGSVSWSPYDPSPIKYINVPIVNNGTVEFNKDFLVQFYADTAHTWNNALPGNISQCTVTILFDKQPAGAGDRTYNMDNVVTTIPPYNKNPGLNGPAYAVFVQPDGNSLIGGDFSSYDSTNSYNIARALSNGQPDAAFIRNTGSGADSFIDAIALDSSNNIFIGGAFASFNGIQRNGIAHLNSNGTLDNSIFLPGSGANGTVTAILVQTNGQLLVAGNFSSFNNTNRNCIARLNPDGSVDSTFDAGTGPLDEYSPGNTVINSLALQADGRILVGGDFTTFDGVTRNYLARLNFDGTLDASFDTGDGANDVVNGVAVDTNGLIVAVGPFTKFGALGTSAGITRLETNGVLDTTFNVGSGVNDAVNSVVLQTDGRIIIGGSFTSFNQTRRVGIARLNPDGSLDTSFMDTAYNQFAGVVNPIFNPDINPNNSVYSLSLQPDGGVIIGGSFSQVGGGSTRASLLPRGNVARLIGGATPGPGNIGLALTSYIADAANNGSNTNSTSTITVTRSNGILGPASATVAPVTLPTGPGAAIYGTDFLFNAAQVNYGTTWANTWMLSDGVAGTNSATTVTVYNNNRPNAVLDLEVTAPVGQDIFFLGGSSANKNTGLGIFSPAYGEQDGENIPLGVALGQSLSPLTIIHKLPQPGVLSFTTPTYTTNEGSGTAIINVYRANGSDGQVSVFYKTVDGSAKAGIDYVSSSGKLTFNAGITNQVFKVTLLNNGISQPDRFINLVLYTTSGGATLSALPGGTNAQIILINNNYAYGNVSFAGGLSVINGSTNVMTYGTNENSGSALVTITRQGGSSGVLSVNVASSDVTAVNGVNYTGFTNVLTWQNQQAQPQTIVVPVKQDGVYTANLTAKLRIFNATVNGVVTTQALGGVSITGSLIISNVDYPGKMEFSAPTYTFNENGGSAIIPVIRTGGTAGTIANQFSTVDGTAIAGNQYVATNGTITLTNGQVSAIFRVPIIDNLVPDTNYQLSVVLKNQTTSDFLGDPSTATLNIINNETYNYPPGQIDTQYNPLAGFSGPVFALALQPSNGKLLVGGGFTNANGVARNRIARLNTDGTLDQKFSSYLPGQGASDAIRSILVESNGTILVGGFFTNFNGVTLNRIARLTYSAGLDSTFNPGSGVDAPIYAFAQYTNSSLNGIYVAGAFTTYNGSSRNAIARINENGTIDQNFKPGTGANGTVYALGVQADGKVVIGGDFTMVNGVPLRHVARLNIDGSVDYTFANALYSGIWGANDSVHAVAIQLDGHILIGGLFTNVDGVALNHIARLNTDGTLDNTFTPGIGANGDVLTITPQTDTRIVVGGNFTSFSGVTRNRITRLNPDGTVDPTINFGTGADSFVGASVIQNDGNIILGGGFQNFEGTPRANLVRVYGGSAAGFGTFEFSTANFACDQTNAFAVVSVQRLGGTSGTNADGTGDLYINLTTSDGSALANTNYISVSTNLDFPAGEVIRNVAIPLINVPGVFPNLTVKLSITNTPPAALGNQPTATLTIINSQSAVSLLSSNYSVAKNAINGAGIITLVRQGSTNGTCSVDFLTTTNGSASIGNNYTPVQGTVTFYPGDAIKTFQIPINNNGVAEGNKTVTFVLTNSMGTYLYSPSNAVLTIIDTVNAPGQLYFATNSYTVMKQSGNAYVTVGRTNGSSGTVYISYSTVQGTAIPGVNYQTSSGIVALGDGVTSQNIAIPLYDNNLAQGTVNFIVNLFNPGGGATLAAPTNAVVNILDHNVGFSFLSQTNFASESDSSALVFVQRLGATNLAYSVKYVTTNNTALAGTNYVALANTLNFAPGESLKSISVPLIYYPQVTGDLLFGLFLTNATAGAQLVNTTNTLVIIHDSDAGLNFSTASTNVLKNAGSITLQVICSNPSVEPIILSTNTIPLQVNYFTTNGTAISGIDYTAVSGTLTFTNGIGTNLITVPIKNNGVLEGNRTFNVVLTAPTAPGKLTPPSIEQVNIIDVNSAVEFSSPTYTVLKSGVQANINVYRTGYTDSIVSVNYTATNGTAVGNVNFVPVSGTLVFTNGVTVQSFSVPIISSTVVQPDLTVQLLLSAPNNAGLSYPSFASLTIIDLSGSLVVPAGAMMVEPEGYVPANGIVDPGETDTIRFGFRAGSGTNVANLIATLLATNGISSPSGPQIYGPLVVGGPAVSRPFTLTANGTNGQAIVATFKLMDGTKNIGTNNFTFYLGTWTASYSNTAPIIINDFTTASPYPSSINVSGLPGVILKTTVTFTNLTHSAPGDIGALVVAPNQQDTLLMNRAGAANSIKNVTLIFDDSASNSLPKNLPTITTGTNKPTAYPTINTFP